MAGTMSKWIYLSYPLNRITPAYGGGDTIKIRQEKNMETGASCNTQHWSSSNHLGTHIDFPKHFARGGATSSSYNPGFWIFDAPFILEISTVEPGVIIEPEALEMDIVPDDTDILIIKTGFCHLRDKDIYWKNNPGFDPAFAIFLRKSFPHLRVLGFDSISLSSFAHRKTGREAHKSFLDHYNPILLLEDMDLTLIGNGTKLNQIIVSPLLVEGADASPSTVFASVLEGDNHL
jgi:kynurenine formamidase